MCCKNGQPEQNQYNWLYQYQVWSALESQHFLGSEIVYDDDHEYGIREMSGTGGYAHISDEIIKGGEKELMRFIVRMDGAVYYWTLQSSDLLRKYLQCCVENF